MADQSNLRGLDEDSMVPVTPVIKNEDGEVVGIGVPQNFTLRQLSDYFAELNPAPEPEDPDPEP